MTNMDQLTQIEILKEMNEDLDRVFSFWLKYSHDDVYGGFITCLGKDGTWYDDIKYGWLNARQVWMYSKMYQEVQRYRNDDVVRAAKKGADFLMRYIKFETGEGPRCYFSVTRDGRPLKIQRTIYTECFYVMAMAGMAAITGSDIYEKEAITVMKRIVHWVCEDDTSLGQPKLSGQTPSITLGYPMMILCVILELKYVRNDWLIAYDTTINWAIAEIMKHIQRDGRRILEHVTPEGEELPGCAGRLMNPGHAIECGWFLLEIANAREDNALKKVALENFISSPYEYGRDEIFGGLFYFLDADGLPPAQLEWNMKLWWVHNEALISFLMAYKETKDEKYMVTFKKLFDYTYSHFVDRVDGEWYGYLNRQGEVNMEFKGGAWKGCFHVPRCLLKCIKLLNELIHHSS